MSSTLTTPQTTSRPTAVTALIVSAVIVVAAAMGVIAFGGGSDEIRPIEVDGEVIGFISDAPLWAYQTCDQTGARLNMYTDGTWVWVDESGAVVMAGVMAGSSVADFVHPDVIGQDDPVDAWCP